MRKDHTCPPSHLQCQNTSNIIQVAQICPSSESCPRCMFNPHGIAILVRWIPHGMPPYCPPFYPLPHFSSTTSSSLFTITTTIITTFPQLLDPPLNNHLKIPKSIHKIHTQNLSLHKIFLASQ